MSENMSYNILCIRDLQSEPIWAANYIFNGLFFLVAIEFIPRIVFVCVREIPL